MFNKIEVPPLSVYELSVCNTVRELCQLRDNLYSCDMYIDMTDINAMLNVVCNIKHTGNTPQLHVNESFKQRDYNVCIW